MKMAMDSLANEGLLFPSDLMTGIKDRFLYVDRDPDIGERLFFDNAGGSFRLKKANEVLARIDAIPDCPERNHRMALQLQQIQDDGIGDVKIIFNAEGGSVFTALTASEAMFDVVRAIAENVSGTNMVTTVLEHPSAYDAMVLYADRLGKELRVASSNPVTGGVDVEEITRLVDKDTCLLNVMFASNISGAVLDIEAIVAKARAIKPDLFIVVDAVQHAPHGFLDLQRAPVDAITFAPYKFFGSRGSGIAWLSDRAAALPHHKLTAKAPDFWELGSPAPAQFAVVTEIVNYVNWIGSKYVHDSDRRTLYVAGMTHILLHERALMSLLLNGNEALPGLRNMDNVEVFLDYEDLTKRDLILAMGFKNIGYTEAVKAYEQRNVIVYERIVSSLYSVRMLKAFGMEGAVRVSPLHCNSPEDIEQFLKLTMDIASL
jgi:cysteine desulfurase/selenocysteine lyase